MKINSLQRPRDATNCASPVFNFSSIEIPDSATSYEFGYDKDDGMNCGNTRIHKPLLARSNKKRKCHIKKQTRTTATNYDSSEDDHAPIPNQPQLECVSRHPSSRTTKTTNVLLRQLPSDAPEIVRNQTRGTRDSMVVNAGTQPSKDGRKVRFTDNVKVILVESDNTDQEAVVDPTIFWYRRDDLELLFEHEIKIALRALERPQKHLHCCWRGLEHIERQVDKAHHITQHVLNVLVIHHDLKRQEEEGVTFHKKSASEILRIKSKHMTKEDRKRAYMLGLQDAVEATTVRAKRVERDQLLEQIMEEVRSEHAERRALQKAKEKKSSSRRLGGRPTRMVQKSVRASRNGVEKSVRGIRGFVTSTSSSPEKKSNGSQRNYNRLSLVATGLPVLKPSEV